MLSVAGDRVLVTGGSGFIGTNLIDFFISENVRVRSIDIVPPRNILHREFYKNVDICDFDALNLVVQEYQPTLLVHMAARTDLDGKSLDDYSANVKGVDNLCKCISQCKSIKNVVFASSMLVCRVGYIPRSRTDYCPSTIYGESKVMTEKIVFSYHDKLPQYCVVRPTSIWGPWFGAPYLNFFKMVMGGRFFKPGDQSCTKTYGFVQNAVFQVVSLLHAGDSNGNLKYLGDSEPINIGEWADEIARQSGVRRVPTFPLVFYNILAVLGDVLSLIGVSFPMTSFRLKNMLTDNVIPREKIAELGDFSPISTEEGVRRTLVWLAGSRGAGVD